MLVRLTSFLQARRRSIVYISLATVSSGLAYLKRKLEWELDDGYIYLPKELIHIDSPWLDSQHCREQQTFDLLALSKQTLLDLRSTACYWLQEWRFVKEVAKKPQSLLFDLQVLLESPLAKPVSSSRTRIHLETQTIDRLDIDTHILHLIDRARRLSGLTERATYLCIKTQAAFQADRRRREIGHHTTDDHILAVRDETSFYEQYSSLYTQAILECLNSSRDHALSLLEAGLLVLFHRLENVDKHELESDEHDWMWLWMSRCTAALSKHPETHAHLYYAQWGRYLSRWLDTKNNHKPRVRLEAIKSICNLCHYDRLSKSIYLLNNLESCKSPPACDIVFVHGLKGGVLRTWRQADRNQNNKDRTLCWPSSWLAQDLPRARILAVDYETSLSHWTSFPGDTIGGSLKESSEKMFQELLEAGVGRRPIIWVTHSMGGLLVKNMLTTDEDYIDHNRRRVLEATRGVVFYSVPHRGSNLAVWSPSMQRLIAPSGLVQELRLDNPVLEESNRRFVNIAASRALPILSFTEGRESRLISKPFEYKAFFVTKESADIGLGPLVELPEEDHLSVCKPYDREAVSYAKLLQFIKSLNIC